jgi:hypothetical protein
MLALTCATAEGTQERILQPHRVHTWVDAGEPFGEVEVDISATGRGESCRIVSIRLTVAGKTYTVPAGQFRDLRNPWLSTVELHRALQGKELLSNLVF